MLIFSKVLGLWYESTMKCGKMKNCLIEPSGNKKEMYHIIKNVISKLLFMEEFCNKVFNYQITSRCFLFILLLCETIQRNY